MKKQKRDGESFKYLTEEWIYKKIDRYMDGHRERRREIKIERMKNRYKETKKEINKKQK